MENKSILKTQNSNNKLICILILLVQIWTTNGNSGWSSIRDRVVQPNNYEYTHSVDNKAPDENVLFQNYGYYPSPIANDQCNCVTISECPVALDVLNRKSTSMYAHNLARRFTCGYDGYRIYICCNYFTNSVLFKRHKQKRAYHSYNKNWGQKKNPNEFYWDEQLFPHWNGVQKKPNSWNAEEDDCSNGWFGSRRRTTTRRPYIPWDETQPDEIRPEIPIEITTTTEATTTMLIPPVEPPAVDPVPEVPEVPATLTLEEATTREQKRAILNRESCGITVANRIVGGEDAQLGDYPWMARLGYTREGNPRTLFRCGGSLISDRHVLTVAHCVTSLPNGLVLTTIRLGELDERTDVDCSGSSCADPPQDFSPGTVTVHPNYNNPRLSNDIAVVRLNTPATMTAYVGPLCLPFPESRTISQNYTGMQVVVAGWGATNSGINSGSPTLKWVRLTIMSTEQCMQVYSTRYNVTISNNQICTTGVENVDACEGDSGGPLFVEATEVRRATLLGIVSFGPRRCGTAALPSVYTRVDSYIDWILDAI